MTELGVTVAKKVSRCLLVAGNFEKKLRLVTEFFMI
jgi:hypothetical protein